MMGESNLGIVAQTPESTVVAEWAPLARGDEGYQSEAALEAELIQTLTEQAYERFQITCEADLVDNLRRQLERLNGLEFSEGEWDRFFGQVIASDTDGIVEKTRKIQTDHVQLLKRDDGTTKNVRLIDKDNIHRNSLQVVNQYETGLGVHENRYDVTILVNGLPLVHVELKRRGVAIREAFNQINRYQRESFWSGAGLFEWVQIFVISNGTHTKYYANTTRLKHVGADRADRRVGDSFEFTMWWADAKNVPIMDLVDFTRTFFEPVGSLCRWSFWGRIGVMPKQYPPQVRERAIKMVLSHLDEYGTVYKAAMAIGPKVGVAGESLRRWVQADIAKGTPEGAAAAASQAESKRVKELERKVRDLEEANEILKAASIFFAGELDPRQQRR